jgi:hypothetical protein
MQVLGHIQAIAGSAAQTPELWGGGTGWQSAGNKCQIVASVRQDGSVADESHWGGPKREVPRHLSDDVRRIPDLWLEG